MSKLSVFDKDLNECYSLLKYINEHASWPDEDNHKALASLRAVLHEIRDSVSVGTSANFSAQLPIFIRGIYFERWDYKEELPKKNRTREEFLNSIQNNLKEFPEIKAENAVRVIVKVLKEKYGDSSFRKLENNLTDEVKSIWQSF